nr:DUF4276 family protein [Pseudenhygromyxa sp. WMMC2535]
MVEGQTEERFVKDVLAPHFLSRGLYLTPTLLVTKKVKRGPNFKGGVTTFAKLENDIRRVLKGAGDARVSTIIDYYGLPKGTPGLSTLPQRASAGERVEHVEAALDDHIGDPRFAAFLALHEYEAWLFADGHSLPAIVGASEGDARTFAELGASFETPEDIDDGPQTAPSKRITRIFPGYRKVLHGPMVAGKITLARIRQRCPHFGAWLDDLEGYAA